MYFLILLFHDFKWDLPLVWIEERTGEREREKEKKEKKYIYKESIESEEKEPRFSFLQNEEEIYKENGLKQYIIYYVVYTINYFLFSLLLLRNKKIQSGIWDGHGKLFREFQKLQDH